MNVVVNDKLLVPGVHYLVHPECKGMKGEFKLLKKDSLTYTTSQNNPADKNIVIKKVKKLTWGVSTACKDYLGLDILVDSLKEDIQSVSIRVDQKYYSNYELKNVCGYIRGKVKSDSFLVFTAHYDHLGNMGKRTFFPGANDNASGVSMLFSLIDYYKKNPPEFSIVFICFAAEEAGLLGSKYFTENPLFNLSAIKFLINLDLLGTGDDGITVVNATEFKSAFETLKTINEKQQLLPLIKPRGKAANSDHYWFTEKGIPSFFIYTLGGIKAYHDIYDVEKTLPLTKFSAVKKLLIDFATSQMN
jgi:Zn-dependent M28 family amino/carboxypeptidase